MDKRLVILLLLALLGAAAVSFRTIGSWRRHVPRDTLPPGRTVPAPACDTLACPPYKSVFRQSDFEIREYEEAVWAESEPILEASFNKASLVGFHRLFQYIQGRNTEGVHIPMTAPVLTAIKPSAGPFASSAFTVGFFVPPQFSDHPPIPSQGLAVKVVKFPRRCAAIRRFPGFATDCNIVHEAKFLADSLENTKWANVSSQSGDSEAYSIAQYNSPFEFFNRVNEVWVPFAVEEGADDCSPASQLIAVS